MSENVDSITLAEYTDPRYLEALAFGDLFCTLNGWEVVDVDMIPDDWKARVTLWHYGREFKLLLPATERLQCSWQGCYWLYIDRNEP